MKTPITKITTLLATAVLLLGFVQAAPAFAAMPGTIQGYWVITQAAQYSQGVAPTVVACGAFNIAITSSSPLKAPSGTFSGTITTSTTSGSAGSITLPNGQVSGKWMTLPSGALLISFSGSNFLGSISSPNALPSPSISPPSGCGSMPQPGTGFLGLLHLPGQGTEGMTLYGTSL